MEEEKLKYNIKDRLYRLPLRDYQAARKRIPQLLGKSLRTFDRFCNLKLDSYSDITAKDLDIIAKFLECDSHDLKNYKV